MASGGSNKFVGSYTGAGADIDIETVPFQPRVIKFWSASAAVWGLKMADQDGMATTAYISNSGADAGVTINSDGFTVANGADVNPSGSLVYFECED